MGTVPHIGGGPQVLGMVSRPLDDSQAYTLAQGRAEAGMRKRVLVLIEGVSNIELFYDLIFVYAISVITSLCHNVQSGFLDLDTWLIYLFCFLVVLQVWFYSTLLLNRFSDRSPIECVGLFVNMFLLYFLANGVQRDWAQTAYLFNITWAGILVNLAIQWIIKLRTYTNLDENDRLHMRSSAITLLMQATIAASAAFLPESKSEAASWIALLFGMFIWAFSSRYRSKQARFDHVAERCSLLTIIAFGEMLVVISSYMVNMSYPLYPVGVFLLVVGLFLIYIFEHDHMLDHHAQTDGMTYMTISSWLIVIIGNLTVALEYMQRSQIDFIPKSIYLSACLVLYLLTSFLLGIYNKPEYRYSKYYVIGRLTVCVFIVAVGVLTSFDPAIGIVCHVLAIYAAFGYEYFLWHRRTKQTALGKSVGITYEDD